VVGYIEQVLNTCPVSPPSPSLPPPSALPSLLLPRATGLSPQQLSSCFTTDVSSTPLRVVPWGTLGDTWPYFRPNFTALEELRVAAGAQQVSVCC
jgi:hypothetical protein